MPSDPTLQFRIYVYIQLIVTKLGIFKGVTSWVTQLLISNINCKCTLNIVHQFPLPNMQNDSTKIGCHRGTIIRKGTRQEVPDCKQKSNGIDIQSFGLALGSFLMNQILLALHKHMNNLALYAFQMYFESNVFFTDGLFMTPELLQKTLQEFTLSSYIQPLWEEKEQVFMSILQLLKEQNLLLSPGIQHKNFNYLIPLHPSMVTSSHLLRILTLKLWLASGQERLMARQISIKCIWILKTITRNSRTCECHVECLIPKWPYFVIFIRTEFPKFYPDGGLGIGFVQNLSAHWLRPNTRCPMKKFCCAGNASSSCWQYKTLISSQYIIQS